MWLREARWSHQMESETCWLGIFIFELHMYSKQEILVRLWTKPGQKLYYQKDLELLLKSATTTLVLCSVSSFARNHFDVVVIIFTQIPAEHLCLSVMCSKWWDGKPSDC